jgi:hypothetical protein
MEYAPFDDRKRNITHSLSCLPKKMLQLHGKDNVVEFVLHELSKEDCFNLDRVAYVVDNPDFNCVKGVAGYCYNEKYAADKDIWSDPDSFTSYMSKAPFNNKVRSYAQESYIKRGCSEQDLINEVSQSLGFSHPVSYSWTMKHDNHGILLYEKRDGDTCDCDYLLDGLCLIGFCPIF